MLRSKLWSKALSVMPKTVRPIVLKNPKLVTDPNVKNDPAMEKLVSDWILRVGDSGWFGLSGSCLTKGKLKTKKIQVAVEHNNTDFVASIRSELPSENEARIHVQWVGVH